MVLDAAGCERPSMGSPPAPVERTSRIWSGREIKVLTSAPPGSTDDDLAPLLPGGTITAIRSKRRRLPKVTTSTASMDAISSDRYHQFPTPNFGTRPSWPSTIPEASPCSTMKCSPETGRGLSAQYPPVKAGIHRHRHQRSAIYNFLQRLHVRSPKSVAERVLDCDLSYEGLIAERSFPMRTSYVNGSRYSSVTFVDLAGDHPGPPMNDLIFPILVSDIKTALASMKESSPGPDGLRLNILWEIPVEVITLLCNLLLLKGPLPSLGKAGNIFTSRVAFIKKVEVPTDPLEFRPIAIGNYFVRVFHRVLASRFEASFPNHQDQVGFQNLDGIAHNVLKLHATISEARNKNENLVVASVDIRKAFDSLSHEALLGILKRKVIPDLLLNYFRSYFSSSRLQIGRDLVHPTSRGVKQGDPLSPWLFNIAMDQVLEGQAYSIGVLMLNQMAYADDLILFASSPEEMQKRIDRLLVGLGRLGIELNALKCRVLCIRGNKKRQVLLR